MSEWLTDDGHEFEWGIDVEGRKMWYEAWPVDSAGDYRQPDSNEIAETYGCSGEAVAESLVYLEECAARELTGVSDPAGRLIDLLNRHVLDERFYITRNELLDESRWYTAEYYFYFIMFTKKIMGRYDFHFGEGSDNLLSNYHRIYEKGWMSEDPWKAGKGDEFIHDYSIVNNSGPLYYLEKDFKIDTTDFIYFINASIPGSYSVDRDFYDSETYWVSGEMIQYGYEFFKILSNNMRFSYWAGYHTTLRKATTSRVLLNAPRSLVVFAFKKLVSKTNNVFDYNFISFRDGNFRFNARLKDDFNRQQYGKHIRSCINNNLITNLGAFLGAVELIYRPSARIKERYDLAIGDSVEFAITYLWPARQKSIWLNSAFAGIGVALFLFVILFFGRNHHLADSLSLSLFAALLIGGLYVQVGQKKDLAVRLEENVTVFTEQLEFLEKTSNDLLIERNMLEERVQLRTADLARANEQLRELDSVKTRFFMNISHELRTPLALMLAPLEEIRKGRYGSTLAASNPVFRTMEKNGRRLLKLISNILDFSKIEAGRMQITKKPVDIGSLVTNCVSSVQSAAGHAGILLTAELPRERVVTLVDPELMENALLNLLSNAIKFNHEGGRVTVRVTNTDTRFSLSVQDTGIGIPKEFQEKIFERFGQVDTSSTRKYEGTGIGLALTKEIIEMHDGTIDLVSEPEKGSLFTLEIPLLSPQESEDLDLVVFEEEPEDVYGLEPEEEVQPDPASMERETIGTVLVVEDNDDMRNLLTFLLEEKFRVIQATQGREALALLEEHGPKIDLVLSDVMMPAMDGFELVEAIRDNLEWRFLPVILLTARADVEDTVYGITTGASDYIAKPFNREELMARVSSHLKLKQLHESLIRREGESRDRTVTEEAREKIDLVLSFLRDNYREDLSREGLAAAVEMSPDHLSRTFKKHTGKRINDVINELRTEEAARLISETDEKIITICHEVGFESLRTFNRVFSGIKGISPTEWRNNGEISQSIDLMK